MDNRFSKLYKNSATLKAEQKLSMQLSKKQKAVEINGNGTSGIRISEGVNTAPIGWIFILPVMLIADRASENWIWDSIPKEGKKQLRKIWARQARERKLTKMGRNVKNNFQANESE